MSDPHILEIKQQLAALQRKVDHMYDHLTGAVAGSEARIPPLPTGDPGVSPEVAELARSGQAAKAAILHRSQTGVSLAEAKAAVDSL